MCNIITRLPPTNSLTYYSNIRCAAAAAGIYFTITIMYSSIVIIIIGRVRVTHSSRLTKTLRNPELQYKRRAYTARVVCDQY